MFFQDESPGTKEVKLNNLYYRDPDSGPACTIVALLSVSQIITESGPR